jgi:hypothetical protein
LKSPDIVPVVGLLAQHAWQNTGRTATVGPVCCKAARTVPSRQELVLLGNSGSPAAIRCNRGQAHQSTLKIYAAGGRPGLEDIAGPQAASLRMDRPMQRD